MKVRIISPSDRAKIEYRHWWGDYWVKEDLKEVFRKRGYEIVGKDSDVDLCLVGRFQGMNAKKKFCWLYSHVDTIIKRKEAWKIYAQQFDHIFVLSNKFLKVVKKDFKNSSVLLGASSKSFTSRKTEPKYDIGFIGNAGKAARVEIIKYLISLNKYKICMAGGTGWKKVLGDDFRKIDYVDYVENKKMGDFFNNARVGFYSSHKDMRKNGLVAVRILDIFRSSECLCISDENCGLSDIFKYIPMYKTKEELSGLIDWYLRNPNEADMVAKDCRNDASRFTFEKVVDEIEKYL